MANSHFWHFELSELKYIPSLQFDLHTPKNRLDESKQLVQVILSLQVAQLSNV